MKALNAVLRCGRAFLKAEKHTLVGGFPMSPSGEAAAPASAPSTSAAYVPTLFARTSGPAGVVRDLYSIHLCDRHVSPLSFG